MKNLPVLLLLVFIAAVSCKKKKESPAPAAGTYPLNQLTGIKYKAKYDSTGGFHGIETYVKWTFSGTNPIIAMPSDEVHFGRTTMYFTGALATKLVLSDDTLNYRNGTTATISYNAANMPDTIFIDYPHPFIGISGAYDRAFVFEYSGTKITKITKVVSAGYVRDTLNWAHPYCYYYYTYSGENVSQVVKEYYPVDPSSTSTSVFTTSAVKNNLARALPQYLLLEFMAAMNSDSDFPDHLPFYLSENMIVSGGYTSGPTQFSYTTDSRGRITQMVSPGQYVFDSTFYYY